MATNTSSAPTYFLKVTTDSSITTSGSGSISVTMIPSTGKPATNINQIEPMAQIEYAELLRELIRKRDQFQDILASSMVIRSALMQAEEEAAEAYKKNTQDKLERKERLNQLYGNLAALKEVKDKYVKEPETTSVVNAIAMDSMSPERKETMGKIVIIHPNGQIVDEGNRSNKPTVDGTISRRLDGAEKPEKIEGFVTYKDQPCVAYYDPEAKGEGEEVNIMASRLAREAAVKAGVDSPRDIFHGKVVLAVGFA